MLSTKYTFLGLNLTLSFRIFNILFFFLGFVDTCTLSCKMCSIARRLGDPQYLPFVPCTGVAVRFKVRILGGIAVSIINNHFLCVCGEAESRECRAYVYVTGNVYNQEMCIFTESFRKYIYNP